MASEAKLHGSLQYESGHGKDNIGYWTNPEDSASWAFKVDRPGKFKANTDIAALAAAQFEVIVEGQELTGTSPATKDYTKFESTSLNGTLDLAAGNWMLTVKPIAEKWQPINLRSVTLQPAQP
jgi:alpha-L-fucosidase